MASELQDFDLRCRGAYKVAEDWQASSRLRAVWAFEDVVALYNEFLPAAVGAYETYCRTGNLPAKATLNTILDHLRGLSFHGTKLVEVAGTESANTLEVEGVTQLRSNVATAQGILQEEDYATDMSFLNFSEA